MKPMPKIKAGTTKVGEYFHAYVHKDGLPVWVSIGFLTRRDAKKAADREARDRRSFHYNH